MTTAFVTSSRIERNDPTILISRNNDPTSPRGSVNVRRTAENFIEANIRHIVNRRMKWSSVQRFVETAVDTLVTELRTGNRIPSDSSVNPNIRDLVDTVRRACNRRWSWVDQAEGALISVTETLVLSVLDENNSVL